MVGRVHSRRSSVCRWVFALAAAGLLLRLFQLQCLGFEQWSDYAVGQHRRLSCLEARRGTIRDRGGNILSCSLPVPSLYAVPARISDPAGVASILGPILGLDVSELVGRLKGDGEFAWIKRHLSEEERSRIEELGMGGLGFREEYRRVYPKGSLLANVLGLTDVDGKGIEGLELALDNELRGRDGWRMTGRDSKLREVVWLRDEDIPPINGCNVFLTVDEVVQDLAESELENACRRYSAAWGVALVMDCRTGDILALANKPDYDPNSYPRPPAEIRRNRAITDPVEPGSTFKALVGAAALEAGVVEPSSLFYCENGSFRIGGVVLHDSHPEGNLTFAQILQRSSNIGMAKVGMLLGNRRLHHALRAFRIGQKLGVDIPGESAGILRPVEKWSKISLRSITMGHEISVTPLGLLTAFCALGNAGMVPRPRIVDRVETAGGESVRVSDRTPLGRAVSPETAERMRNILRLVVEREGTGHRARIPGYQVLGKTGTAQKPGPDGRYSHRLFRSLFMGMFPASEPRYAILVMLDEPKGSYYGGTVAAPVFRAIGEGLIRHFDLPPAEFEEES